MSELSAGVHAFLERGREQGLFTAAAAAIRTPNERLDAYTGTHAEDDATPVTADSLFDLASVSKTFTAAILTRLIARGLIDPDEPISSHLPLFTGDGAEKVTLRMLLTHTAGLPADVFLWKNPDVPPEERLPRVLATALQTPPDATFRYSCTGYIAAGALAGELTGRTLPQLLADEVTAPLGLRDTGFGPVPAARAVATEDESYIGRGVVRGEVHDELNWYLGGKVGNAGVFSTAPELLTFAESFLDVSLLEDEAHRLMTTDTIRPEHGAGFGHSLGLRLGDHGFMADVPGYGHTGFTGTMWVVDPSRQTAVVLLTNRVHPHRGRADLGAYRRELNTLVAHAVDGSR